MANQHHGAVIRNVQTLFLEGTVGNTTDRQLLERFVRGTGEAAEFAFAALVERHGPMVSRVCRSVLGNSHDAQDAFQATFLVLVRKASSLWVADSLSPWLYGVAYRVASCAKSAAARRSMHERRAAEGRSHVVGDDFPENPTAALHEALNQLPERQRTAIVLCDLEGLTQEQAAMQLDWPLGTVRSRLARGRERLRDRLTRRGLVPSVGRLDAIGPAGPASAEVPRSLIDATVRAALQFSVDRPAATLAVAVLRAMAVAKLKLVAASLLGFTAVLLGAGALLTSVRDADSPQEPGNQAPLALQAADVKPAEAAKEELRIDEVDPSDPHLPRPARGDVEALLRSIGRDPVTPELVDRVTSLFRPRVRQSGRFADVSRRVANPDFVRRMDRISREVLGEPASSFRLVAMASNYHNGIDDAYLRFSLRESIRRQIQPSLALRGIVVGARTGRPLRGVTVSTSGALVRTGEDGAFVLRFTRPDQPVVNIHFEGKGYALGETVLKVDELPVEDGRKYGLLEETPLEGRVIDREGRPIAGAEVELWVDRGLVNRDDSMTRDVGGGNAMVIRARSDAQGRFSVHGIPPEGDEKNPRIREANAHLSLSVRHPEFRTYVDESRNNLRRAAQPIEIKMVAGCTVAGVVVDHQGRPVPDAEVRVLPPAELAPKQTGYTDREGRFRFGNISPGYWRLVVEPETQARALTEVKASAQQPVDLRLVVGPGGSISGRVIGVDGKPSPRAAVGWLDPIEPRGYPAEDPGPDRITRTAEDGSFRLGPLPEGEYEVLGLEDPPRALGKAKARAGQTDVNIQLQLEKRQTP